MDATLVSEVRPGEARRAGRMGSSSRDMGAELNNSTLLKRGSYFVSAGSFNWRENVNER